MKDLGRKLKHLRLIENLSQEGFANIIQVDQSTYSRIENTLCDPRLSCIAKIAAYYQVKISDLLEKELHELLELRAKNRAPHNA